MEDNIYYTREQLMDSDFYKLPKWLMDLEIQNDAKLLYMLLRDRLSLSIKNEWFDKENRPYIIFTRESVQEKLHVGDKKCTKLFGQLKNEGLIVDKSVGQGKANHIYLKIPKYEKIQNRYFDESENVKKENLEPLKQRGNKNNSSNTDLSSVVVNVQRFKEAIKIEKTRFDEAYRTEEYSNKAIQYAIDSFNCFGEKQIIKINKLDASSYKDIFMVAFDFANKQDNYYEAENPKKVLSTVIKKHLKKIKN